MRNKVTIFIFVVLVTAFIAIAASVLNFFVFGGKNSALEVAEVTVGRKAFQVEVARTTVEHARGLSGREGLNEDSGMIFLYSTPGSHGFWMKDMKFPIDIIWIRGDKVVGFAQSVEPEPKKSTFNLSTYYPPSEVDKVLEVNAGAVEKYGIVVGDEVRVHKAK